MSVVSKNKTPLSLLLDLKHPPVRRIRQKRFLVLNVYLCLIHLPLTNANPTNKPAFISNGTDYFTMIRLVTLVEDSFCITEIVREGCNLVGREWKFDAHPMACPQFLLDFQIKTMENRYKFCFGQFVRDTHSSTADSEVDLISHFTSTKKAGRPETRKRTRLTHSPFPGNHHLVDLPHGIPYTLFPVR